jgi:polyferredoxin
MPAGARPPRLARHYVGAQLVLLGFLLGLIGVACCVGLDGPAAELRGLGKANLGTLLLWGIWWPAMVVGAILVGRGWCTVCPLELVNRAGDRIAARLRLPRLRPGRFLLGGWAAVGAHLVLLLALAGAGVWRYPHATAVVLVAITVVALATGLLFHETRSFCSGFCPAAAMLSAYGRHAPWAIDVKDPSWCSACTSRECEAPPPAGAPGANVASPRLPVLRELPADCALCLQCAQPPATAALTAMPGEACATSRTRLLPFEAAFIAITSGFVARDLVADFPRLGAIFNAFPDAAARALAISPSWPRALWAFLLFPALAWGLGTLAARLAGLERTLRAAALAVLSWAAPVVAGLHVAKAVVRVAGWGGFLPLALRDPTGTTTAEALASHVLAPPVPLAQLTMTGVTSLLAAAVLAWWILRPAAPYPLNRCAILPLSSSSSASGVVPPSGTVASAARAPSTRAPGFSSFPPTSTTRSAGSSSTS